SFCMCSALRRWLHTTSMKPATRLEHEQKSGVIPVDFIFSGALTPQFLFNLHPVCGTFHSHI
ncbi:MAG: hypothetical protein U9Q05_03230, partial [Thermodesulfobacteriota bacterium]|nr:hypothetical protein [Thermodesulfobacteriota bacterium]